MICKVWNCTISEIGCAKRHFLSQQPSNIVTHHDCSLCKECEAGIQNYALYQNQIGQIKGTIYTRQAPPDKRKKRGMSAYTFHYAL